MTGRPFGRCQVLVNGAPVGTLDEVIARSVEAYETRLDARIARAIVRIMRKGGLSFRDLDPERIRALLVGVDMLANRARLRAHGYPAKRYRYSIPMPGKPSWYLV